MNKHLLTYSLIIIFIYRLSLLNIFTLNHWAAKIYFQNVKFNWFSNCTNTHINIEMPYWAQSNHFPSSICFLLFVSFCFGFYDPLFFSLSLFFPVLLCLLLNFDNGNLFQWIFLQFDWSVIKTSQCYSCLIAGWKIQWILGWVKWKIEWRYAVRKTDRRSTCLQTDK